ncbi:MAG: hypothetical protein M5U31_03755 [Acidimicrobiia bacterium]|nr:hypothetical protein [Acidimicrobiia bacterium]
MTDTGDGFDPSGLPRSRAERRQTRRRRRIVAIVGGVVAVVALGVAGAFFLLSDDSSEAVATDTDESADAPTTTTSAPAEPAETPPETEPPAPFEGWVNPASVGKPFPGATVEGLLTFRGNPTRTFYGAGPVPTAPEELWRYPDEAMCSLSSDKGEETRWCGTGWTGQPAVFERDDRTWVTFGAYDRAVHFVDGDTGDDILPPFPHRRHHQGVGEHRPRGLPASLHGIA